MVPAKPVIPCMMLDKSMTRKNTAYPIIYYLLSFLYSIRRLAAPGHPFAPSVLAYPNIHSRLSPVRPLYHISCRISSKQRSRTPNPSGKMPGYNLRVHPRFTSPPWYWVPRSTGGPILPQEDTHPSFPCLQGRPGHQKVPAQQVFILDGICLFILLMVKEQRPLYRYALLGIFLYQGLSCTGPAWCRYPPALPAVPCSPHPHNTGNSCPGGSPHGYASPA